MFLELRTREEVLRHAKTILSEQDEAWAEDEPDGAAIDRRELNRKLTEFIREQKRNGRLVERRPYVEATSKKRGVQFIVVPQNLELF